MELTIFHSRNPVLYVHYRSFKTPGSTYEGSQVRVRQVCGHNRNEQVDSSKGKESSRLSSASRRVHGTVNVASHHA